jgi:D-3-phosphoglycerate dehydrogenase / 2-oxoglutarate reductase
VHKVSIIGDRFMLSSAFADAIHAACRDHTFEITQHDLAWPDEPMEHGYAVPGMDGLKEYMGSEEDILRLTDGANVLVTQLAPLSARMMDRLPDLRLVVVARGGPVNIDTQAARMKGLTVVNTPGRNATAVAEFTIGAILSQTRNITTGHESLRSGQYRGDLYRAGITGRELSEMTVGIIGYGEVGSRVVRLLKAFSCRILVADPYVQLSVADLKDGVTQCSLDFLLEQSDVVSMHQRVTTETNQMINRPALLKMKVNATLINTARGPLLDYEALHDVMASGHLRGAMLDTFSIEPVPPDWPLLKLENVTLTPHIAGASIKTIHHAARCAAEEVRRFFNQEGALNPC